MTVRGATPTGRIRGRNGIAVGLAVAVLAAACGSTAPTPPKAATPAPTATGSVPAATPTVAATPTATQLAIVPVPTSQFATLPPASSGIGAATGAALQKALDSIQKSGGDPGISAAIITADGSSWSGQSGQAVISSKTPVTADTLFSIGSISKTFVSALAGRLAARGTIGLDDPLSKYLPSYPNAAKITLRELLNHTSGLRDIFETSSLNAAISAQPNQVWTADKILASVGSPYFTTPGKNYHYSNTNYVLMGQVIEKATGQPLESLVRSEFLTPLGLDHTFYQVTEQAAYPKADAYMGTASAPLDQWPGSKMIPFTAEVTAVGPAGAYVSNASDLARWANALYNGDVLDAATLASIVDVSPTLPFKFPFPYGLGFEETTVAGQLSWGHRGHLDGMWAAMEYLPGSHLTIVVLTNAEWAKPVNIAAALAAIVQAPAS
jgi:D-alanyl-D-alanine carboxypeptidase